eukprot:scaffold44200_cov57-Phaeocystis_antarctica.AAC.1
MRGHSAQAFLLKARHNKRPSREATGATEVPAVRPKLPRQSPAGGWATVTDEAGPDLHRRLLL